MLKGLGGLGGLGALGDMTKMLKAAQEMQGKMAQLTEEMKDMIVSGEAGAGLVKVTCTAKGDLKSLSIDASLFNPAEKEVAEDLILAAVKDAQKRAAERHKEELAKLSQSLGLPPDMKLPF
jgi:DNA-binding YbaB/EbfC family protein